MPGTRAAQARTVSRTPAQQRRINAQLAKLEELNVEEKKLLADLKTLQKKLATLERNLSNVMKTKHDTAKNAISNVR